MGADGIKEVTVVAHNENSILEVGEIIFEPCHSFEVKVVGGLVEQKVVGVAEECFGE